MLKEYMAKNDLTQAQVADAIGVFQSSISRILNGQSRMSPEIARRLHDYYGIPLHELRPDIWDAREAAE